MLTTSEPSFLELFFFDTSKSRKPAPGAPHTAHTLSQPRKASKQIVAAQTAQLHKKATSASKVRLGQISRNSYPTRPSVHCSISIAAATNLTSHCTHIHSFPTDEGTQQAGSDRSTHSVSTRRRSISDVRLPRFERRSITVTCDVIWLDQLSLLVSETGCSPTDANRQALSKPTHQSTVASASGPGLQTGRYYARREEKRGAENKKKGTGEERNTKSVETRTTCIASR